MFTSRQWLLFSALFYTSAVGLHMAHKTDKNASTWAVASTTEAESNSDAESASEIHRCFGDHGNGCLNMPELLRGGCCKWCSWGTNCLDFWLKGGKQAAIHFSNNEFCSDTTPPKRTILIKDLKAGGTLKFNTCYNIDMSPNVDARWVSDLPENAVSGKYIVKVKSMMCYSWGGDSGQGPTMNCIYMNKDNCWASGRQVVLGKDTFRAPFLKHHYAPEGNYFSDRPLLSSTEKRRSNCIEGISPSLQSTDQDVDPAYEEMKQAHTTDGWWYELNFKFENVLGVSN